MDLLNQLNAAYAVINEAFGYFDMEKSMSTKAKNTLNTNLSKSKYAFFIILPIAFVLFWAYGLALSLLRTFGVNEEFLQKIIPLVFFLSPAGAAVIYLLLVRPIINRKNKKYKDEYNAKINEANELYNRGVSILRENEDTLAFLPEDYRYPLAVSCFIKYALEGRAPTLQDALDRFDEQQHRWKMEEAQQQMLKMQQQQMNQLNAIRRDVNWNTAISSIGAVASIARRL